MGKITKKSESKSVDTNIFSHPTLFPLSSINKKPVEVSFTAEKISTDGGLLLMNEVENNIGIIKAIASCIRDDRHQSYVHHSVLSMLSQRVYQIAAGYEDTNDCDTLKDDAVLKMCSGQLPETGSTLASQPTMCRMENQPTRRELYEMAYALLNTFVNSYSNEPTVIIIDCDDTNSNAHGEQQEIVYNDYYGEYCFMPLHIYEGLSGKLITTILKPGRRSKNTSVYGILRRIITHIRKSWENTNIIVRGDSHFCCKELMDWAYTQEKVHFISGLTGNSVLNKLAEVTINAAKREYAQYGKAVKRYHSFEYQAGSWEHLQRVIVKVEANSMGTNIRYIVTDMRQYRTQDVYEKGYCARGNMELRIKDHKLFLQSDRMSCNSFLANQFRLFLHSAAYVLIHALQKEVLRNTEYANATMKTIQLKVIKLAARVKEMKTKIRIELPAVFPVKSIFEKCFGIFETLRC
jgi:hypothetical protein